ncbi:MAG TPA: Ku protein [Acidothermaceae bacterium]|jgi:DNA end-binding protein Ku|nr:Ku protein [Acidothermaceae bacterium]
MRSIWKGSISFGLVSIAVKVYSATEEKDISFHQVHRDDGGRIKYKRICSLDGEEVAYNDIAKGYELPDGDVVVLTDDDLAELPLTSSREIDVLQFVPLEQVDPIYFNKSYYLEPDARATKAYVLLRDTLEQSGRVAVVKVALRRREALATLRVREGVITLETMLWPDEIRAPEFGFLDEAVDVRPAEIAMASSLVDSLSGDFDPSDFTDQYRAALESVVEAKIEGRDLIPAPESNDSESSGTVVDLVAALQASIAAVKASAGAAKDSPATKPAAKPAAKKAVAKTSATKTAATKTAPASKSAAAARPAAKKAAPSKLTAKSPAVAKAVEKKPVRARRSA